MQCEPSVERRQVVETPLASLLARNTSEFARVWHNEPGHDVASLLDYPHSHGGVLTDLILRDVRLAMATGRTRVSITFTEQGAFACEGSVIVTAGEPSCAALHALVWDRNFVRLAFKAELFARLGGCAMTYKDAAGDVFAGTVLALDWTAQAFSLVRAAASSPRIS